MNYSSSEEGSNSQQESPNLQRLHEIWKKIKNSKDSASLHTKKIAATEQQQDRHQNNNKSKQYEDSEPNYHPQQSSHHQSKERDKQSSRRSLNSVKRAIEKQQQRNLQARLLLTEKQLSKARENTALLMKKLSEAEEQIQLDGFQLEKLNRLVTEKDQEIALLMGKISHQKSETFGREKLSERDSSSSELEQLKRKLQSKERESQRNCLKIKSLELENQKLSEELTIINEDNLQYKQKLSDAEKAMEEVYLGDQQSKGAQLLELDEANIAIERLIILLKNTEQFKKFGNFAEDLGKQLHFLKDMPKRLRANSGKRYCCSCMEIKIDERLLWSPALCYKVVLDLKLKHNGELHEDCIEEILYELNKVYLAREEAHVVRITHGYESQLAKVKKKTELRYDELVARKQIQRLKKEISNNKFIGNGQGNKGQGGYNLQNLKSIGQYEDEVRLKSKQIKLLHERIRLMETENCSYDKVLYLQGALWIIDKVLEEIQSSNDQVAEYEHRFRRNIENMTQGEDWLSAFKEFFENMAEINGSLVEKLQLMRDSTLKKMGTQQRTKNTP